MDSVMKIVAYFGIILSVIGGIFAVIAHWKTIFRPHSKKLDDNQFEATITLLKALLDPMYAGFYSPKGQITDEMIQKILPPLASSLSSPFIPKWLRQQCNEFWKSFLTNGGSRWLKTRNTNNPTIIFDIIGRQNIYQAHKKLYDQIVLWLKYKDSEFRFIEPTE